MSGRGQQLTERPAARLSEPARNYDACANLTLGYSVVTDRRTLEKIYQAKELQRKRLAQVQAAWGAEIERRARRVLSGESAGESWEDVRNRIARLLTKR